MEGQPVTALKATTASKAPRRAVRRSAVAVAALAAGASLVLSGCSSGQISQTARQVSAVNGNTANVGDVALRDVRILLPQSADYTNAKGGKALLAFSAVNAAPDKSDELSSITTYLGTVNITPAGAVLAPGQTLVAAGPQAAREGAPTSSAATSAAPTSSATATSTASPTSSATATSTASSTTTASPTSSATAQAQATEPARKPSEAITVEIDNLNKDITPGLTYPVTFNFKEGGTVLVNVPVDAGATPRKQG
jgi:hypothetical protein